MQNIPYVKTFNKDGKLENPIDGFYSPAFPNRKTRRQKSPRFSPDQAILSPYIFLVSH